MPLLLRLRWFHSIRMILLLALAMMTLQVSAQNNDAAPPPMIPRPIAIMPPTITPPTKTPTSNNCLQRVTDSSIMKIPPNTLYSKGDMHCLLLSEQQQQVMFGYSANSNQFGLFRLLLDDSGISAGQEEQAIWTVNDDDADISDGVLDRWIFQGDGNLVVRNSTNQAIWSTQTHGFFGSDLVFNQEGIWIETTNSITLDIRNTERVLWARPNAFSPPLLITDRPSESPSSLPSESPSSWPSTMPSAGLYLLKRPMQPMQFLLLGSVEDTSNKLLLDMQKILETTLLLALQDSFVVRDTTTAPDKKQKDNGESILVQVSLEWTYQEFQVNGDPFVHLLEASTTLGFTTYEYALLHPQTILQNQLQVINNKKFSQSLELALKRDNWNLQVEDLQLLEDDGSTSTSEPIIVDDDWNWNDYNDDVDWKDEPDTTILDDDDKSPNGNNTDTLQGNLHDDDDDDDDEYEERKNRSASPKTIGTALIVVCTLCTIATALFFKFVCYKNKQIQTKTFPKRRKEKKMDDTATALNTMPSSDGSDSSSTTSSNGGNQEGENLFSSISHVWKLVGAKSNQMISTNRPLARTRERSLPVSPSNPKKMDDNDATATTSSPGESTIQTNGCTDSHDTTAASNKFEKVKNGVGTFVKLLKSKQMVPKNRQVRREETSSSSFLDKKTNHKENTHKIDETTTTSPENTNKTIPSSSRSASEISDGASNKEEEEKEEESSPYPSTNLLSLLNAASEEPKSMLLNVMVEEDDEVDLEIGNAALTTHVGITSEQTCKRETVSSRNTDSDEEKQTTTTSHEEVTPASHESRRSTSLSPLTVSMATGAPRLVGESEDDQTGHNDSDSSRTSSSLPSVDYNGTTILVETANATCIIGSFDEDEGEGEDQAIGTMTKVEDC